MYHKKTKECEESAYTDSADSADSVADFGFLVYKDFGTTPLLFSGKLTSHSIADSHSH